MTGTNYRVDLDHLGDSLADGCVLWSLAHGGCLGLDAVFFFWCVCSVVCLGGVAGCAVKKGAITL